jgi:hypothetical protein
LTDHKHYEFDLQPARVVPGSEIVARAEQFRQTAHADGIPLVGGSLSAIPPANNNIGSISSPLPDFTQPNFAPIGPTETLITPPSTPPDASTFVPPFSSSP